MKIFCLFKLLLNVFRKKPCLKTICFMLKMRKWWEKANFLMSYFKRVGIWIEMKIMKKLHMYISTKEAKNYS